MIGMFCGLRVKPIYVYAHLFFAYLALAICFGILSATKVNAQDTKAPKTQKANMPSATKTSTGSTLLVDLPPVKNAIGTLEKMSAGMDYIGEHSPGTTFAKLSGKMLLPADIILGVTIEDSLSDPSPVLDRIPGNIVQSLTLTGLADFNQRTIKSILRFKNLKRLRLDRSEVNDEGLAQLARLPNLESIVISHTQIKGTTFTKLCNLKKLTRLDIGSNEISGESLMALRCLKQLQILSIGRCHIRNPHLSFLPSLTELQNLELFDNDLLSDTCLKNLIPLRKLKSLKLDGTHISPRGLLILKGLPLTFVRFNPHVVSSADEKLIEKTFPGISVRENNKQNKNFTIFKEIFEKD